jgi:hypothetical protein
MGSGMPRFISTLWNCPASILGSDLFSTGEEFSFSAIYCLFSSVTEWVRASGPLLTATARCRNIFGKIESTSSGNRQKGLAGQPTNRPNPIRAAFVINKTIASSEKYEKSQIIIAGAARKNGCQMRRSVVKK